MCLAKEKAEVLASECDSTSGIPHFTITKSVHSLDVMARSYFLYKGIVAGSIINPRRSPNVKESSGLATYTKDTSRFMHK